MALDCVVFGLHLRGIQGIVIAFGWLGCKGNWCWIGLAFYAFSHGTFGLDTGIEDVDLIEMDEYGTMAGNWDSPF
jgi:hypothetical protein